MANTSGRRNAAFDKIEFVLMLEGLALVIRAASATGDAFKAASAEATSDHVQAVLNKMDADRRAAQAAKAEHR